MLRTTVKLALLLVSLHLLVGLAVMIIEVAHGVSDDGAGFVLGMLVYYMNLPAVLLLESLDVSVTNLSIVVAGGVQWAIVAVVIAGVHHGLKSGQSSGAGR